MDIYQTFSKTAQDIHNRHFEQKINKDQEIAEKRILNYFKGNLNLSWKTILREINKLNELSRNKYFEQLIDLEKGKIRNNYQLILINADNLIKKLKKINWILLTAFTIQTCIIIWLKWGDNV